MSVGGVVHRLTRTGRFLDRSVILYCTCIRCAKRLPPDDSPCRAGHDDAVVCLFIEDCGGAGGTYVPPSSCKSACSICVPRKWGPRNRRMTKSSGNFWRAWKLRLPLDHDHARAHGAAPVCLAGGRATHRSRKDCLPQVVCGPGGLAGGRAAKDLGREEGKCSLRTSFAPCSGCISCAGDAYLSPRWNG